MARGKLISIEGIEGAGKSTALQFIKDYLNSANINCIFTREPGGTPLAEEMRNILLHHKIDEDMVSEAELLIMFAARAQNINTLILPALNAGRFVVTDRYIDASYAYQGGGRHLSSKLIAILDHWIVDGVYPDLTLLLDISPDLGLERANKRGVAKDRIEREQIDFFTRVRDSYLQRAQEDPTRMKIIDASQSLVSVQNQIRDILNAFIAK